MTDDKKNEGAEGFDWDQALAEWDQKDFSPEVAKDTSTEKPASLSGSSPFKPLYRPPAAGQARPAPPPAPPPPPPKAPEPPPPLLDAPDLDDDDESGATVIAAIPRELLRQEEAGPKSSSRGGLGQMFAREERKDEKKPTKREESVEVSFEESRPVLPKAASPSDHPSEVFTSAQPVERRPGAGGDMPLRRPSLIEPREAVPEGAMFDPFAESEPRSAQSTRPADEELVDDLLAQAPTSSAGTLPPEALADAEASIPPVPPAAAVPVEGGPALLAPTARHYDPNEETMVGTGADLARARAAIAAKRTGSAPPPPPRFETRAWPDEKPASAWLDDGTRRQLAAKSVWLEAEARVVPEKIARARLLLTCSEIAATAGDRERALALATEARDLAPSLALAHRQARGLTPQPPDPEEALAALDAEVKMTPAGPARVHSTLLATETLRASGDEDAAAKRLDAAARIPGDARAAVLRAARALGRGETASAALRIADGSGELASLQEGLGVALRLRGVERKDASGGEPTVAEHLLKARTALDRGDVVAAAPLLAKVATIDELAEGATWLSASLAAVRPATRGESVRLLRVLAEAGDAEARRTLVGRAVETGNQDALDEAIRGPGPLTSVERVALAALAGSPLAPEDVHVEAATTAGLGTLVAAAVALTPAKGDAPTRAARARRTAGSAESRGSVTLGRLLAGGAEVAEVEAALAALESRPPSARALALDLAARAGRAREVSLELEAWGASRGGNEERAVGALAGALIAERGGDRSRALEAFKAVRAAEPTHEAALRAVATLEDVDLVAELNGLADELGDGPRAALTRIEAIARGEGTLPEPTRAELLARAHRAAPALPFASFLAERIARKARDIDDVVEWIRERRNVTTDSIEAALEGIREALLVVDGDAATAAERLQEASRARPGDVALRLLFERMAQGAPDDMAAWRERRAAEVTGDARTALYLEAAQEYERAGDEAAALRCAEAAVTSDTAVARVARERCELRSAQVARLADELLTAAKSTEDARVRREAYERLAVLDATARQDPASALLWHRSILEEQPAHEPSLRYVEHHLVGEGRDDELEPIAASIAQALRGTGPGECTAHAELAARLRARGAEGSWEAGRDMVELAASEGEPSLWATRMLEAHSRAKGNDEAFLGVLRRLVDRTARPMETASLLVHAGEAASRLGRLDEARSLLERASLEDPGDVVVWGLLADVRQRAGDARGAAEACESLARCSAVREHQLLAWYDAGKIWADDARDEERAVVALEAAAAIDPGYAELFDRLSTLYASRKMQPELASLLERRLETLSDPEERLAMEVRRGRVLLEVGDPEGARAAFEAALAQRPDDAGALSAYAELCVAQKDWEAAEQALVRLARLLPTPEEQRDVYARLGDLYSRSLLNLARAEVALKEVLKRAPDDVATTEKLVDVYRRQNDPARAVELHLELTGRSKTPEEKRRRLVELAAIHEQTAHDLRKAEQTLEAARREFPQDVGILRALAEFYIRQSQTPALHILLDRAGSDARRALAAGRVSANTFELLATAFDLRGKKEAAAVTQAMLAALEGRPAEMRGAGERAFDPRLDDLMAPEVLSPAMRALLARTGDALDAAVPVDIRGQRATPLPPDAPLGRFVAGVAQQIGLGSIQVFVSPKLGVACVPASSHPPTLLVGEPLLGHERAARFLVSRALKLVQARAAAFGRTPPADLAVLVAAWLKCFNPSWQPQGVNAAAVNQLGARVQAALPRNLDPEVGVIALEVAGTLGTQGATLGPNALAWGNRVALLAWGDPTSAIDAIAMAGGLPQGAPTEPKERGTFITRAQEARDLIAFGVTDAFAEARARVGLTR